MPATATAAKTEPAPVLYTARRFGLPDLNDTAPWLLPRLAKAWPHMQERAIFGWFHGIIDSSEYFFVRTDHAVSLSQRVNEKLFPQPIVREHFTLARAPEHVDEAAFLYTEIRQWAFRLGAGEVDLQPYIDAKKYPDQAAARMTDCPREMVEAAVGRLGSREVLFARIGGK